MPCCVPFDKLPNGEELSGGGHKRNTWWARLLVIILSSLCFFGVLFISTQDVGDLEATEKFLEATDDATEAADIEISTSSAGETISLNVRKSSALTETHRSCSVLRQGA